MLLIDKKLSELNSQELYDLLDTIVEAKVKEATNKVFFQKWTTWDFTATYAVIVAGIIAILCVLQACVLLNGQFEVPEFLKQWAFISASFVFTRFFELGYKEYKKQKIESED